MGTLTKHKKLGKNYLWTGIIIITALFFLLFLYAPLEIYFYNQDSFWFDVYKLLPVIFTLFLGSTFISSGILFFIFKLSPQIYKVVLAFCCITLLCTYIQGNFMVGNLPPLDGTEINWDNYSSGRIQSVVLWVIVTVLICVAVKILHMERFCKVVNMVGICLILTLFVTGISICITTKGYINKLDAAVTVKDEFLMSKDVNFIILLLDAVDSETLYGMIESQPEYREIFDDFTYYPNTMAAYPFTKHAVPYIFSGVWYENDIPFQKYNVNVYKNSSLFEQLQNQGYELGIYEEELPLLDKSIFRFSNVLDRKFEINSFWGFAKLEIKLIGLKYAPFDFKKKCIFNTNRFLVLRDVDQSYPLYYESNSLFYQSLQEEDITYSGQKMFKFLHVEGAHVPFQYDRDVNVIENGTYENNLEACMTISDTYLKKLKDAEVYDNSVIIVMSDHGYSLTGPDAFGRQNPIFFVKGLNEHHELEITNTPISHEDLQEIFARLLNGASGKDITDYTEDSKRERRYL